MSAAASWYHLPRWYKCIIAKNGGTRAASFATGGAPWVWEPSAPRGESVGFVDFDILVILCVFCNYVYFSACTCYRPYLSRHGSETSRTSSNALSQCGRSRLCPQMPSAASWYHLPPSPVALVHSGQERRDKSGPDPSRIVRNRRSFATGGAPWVWEPSVP